MAKLLIYGASGYTGGLASEYAKSVELDFIVAGRTENKVKELADSLETPYHIFHVDDMSKVDAALTNVAVLLNCAGPFTQTAKPLIEACLRNGVHYLDVSAELQIYEMALGRHKEAEAKGVMLLPGCGGSVAMLGCLAGFAINDSRLENPVLIKTALHITGTMSRGTIITGAANNAHGSLQRVDGELVPADDASCPETFDFGDGRGPVDCFPITVPDLVTLWASTKVGNIRTYANVSGGAFPTGPLDFDAIPDGPTKEQREATPYHAAVAVIGADGSVRRAVLHMVNGYTFTSTASVEAARRVLRGQFRAGFQTPAALFGHSFIEAVAGSNMRHVA